MVNKVRKKDGSLKYPYEQLIPFEDVNALILELRASKNVQWVVRETKAYGIHLYVHVPRNTIPQDVIDILEGYGVKYFIDTYHRTLAVSTYIGYTEFDKEV